ncbi:unnamed protein product [Amoebophrya sp. A25]|nr:unnamed protein product [Amoebophrya sp. A25]|eukprot:GSA25T00009766001.1
MSSNLGVVTPGFAGPELTSTSGVLHGDEGSTDIAHSNMAIATTATTSSNIEGNAPQLTKEGDRTAAAWLQAWPSSSSSTTMSTQQNYSSGAPSTLACPAAGARLRELSCWPTAGASSSSSFGSLSESSKPTTCELKKEHQVLEEVPTTTVAVDAEDLRRQERLRKKREQKQAGGQKWLFAGKASKSGDGGRSLSLENYAAVHAHYRHHGKDLVQQDDDRMTFSSRYAGSRDVLEEHETGGTTFDVVEDFQTSSIQSLFPSEQHVVAPSLCFAGATTTSYNVPVPGVGSCVSTTNSSSSGRCSSSADKGVNTVSTVDVPTTSPMREQLTLSASSSSSTGAPVPNQAENITSGTTLVDTDKHDGVSNLFRTPNKRDHQQLQLGLQKPLPPERSVVAEKFEFLPMTTAPARRGFLEVGDSSSLELEACWWGMRVTRVNTPQRDLGVGDTIASVGKHSLQGLEDVGLAQKIFEENYRHMSPIIVYPEARLEGIIPRTNPRSPTAVVTMSEDCREDLVDHVEVVSGQQLDDQEQSRHLPADFLVDLESFAMSYHLLAHVEERNHSDHLVVRGCEQAINAGVEELTALVDHYFNAKTVPPFASLSLRGGPVEHVGHLGVGTATTSNPNAFVLPRPAQQDSGNQERRENDDGSAVGV